MGLSDIFTLLGGLALFLYGMHMMSAGLEAAAGAKLKLLLEKFTQNRFLAVLVGAGITALVQSSSATTVMVVGFVNSGMMSLASAVWIIMGANMGTTVTGLLITLDMGELAPLITFVGVVMTMFFKSAKVHHYGQICIGLGILFTGMGTMSGAMYPLRNSEEFIAIMSEFSNPVLGILGGAIFTAIIQSSSASIGILQGLAASGVITLDHAIYVLFGQNIGTCITSLIASMGLSRNAKRVTAVHLMFNIFGTLMFTLLTMFYPFTDFMQSMFPDNVQAQIANTHVVFNITTTLFLLPFGGHMAMLAKKIIRKTKEEDLEFLHVEYITTAQTASMLEGGLGMSAIYENQLQMELSRMLTMAEENLSLAFDGVLLGKPDNHEKVEVTEEYIDYLNKEITSYIARVIAGETSEQSSEMVSSYFTINSNVERLGDHAVNISGYSRDVAKHKIRFSAAALNELQEMKSLILEGTTKLKTHASADIQWLSKVAALEQKIDDVTAQFRKNHLRRMRDGVCDGEEAVLYAELLMDFERLGDHILNIGEEYAYIQTRN